MPQPAVIPRVLAVVDSTYATDQKFLSGILKYIRTNGPWQVDLRLGRMDDAPLHPEDYDGLILKAPVEVTCPDALRKRIPVIQLDGHTRTRHTVAHVHADNVSIARTAARFLLTRRCRTYATVGAQTTLEWSTRRMAVFRREIAREGIVAEAFEGTEPTDKLVSWLLRLPKPAGIFAVNDFRAREVLDACRKAGLEVPGDITLLGVDNDELLCETSSPALSSIPMDIESAGYRAAELLARAMAAKSIPACVNLFYGGSSVVERQSTEVRVSSDVLVRRCCAMIAEHAERPFDVPALVAAAGCSRRYLEMRFKRILGRTPAAEIRRQRVNRAIVLLECGLSQSAAAARCHFADVSHMHRIFKSVLGKRPSEFQREQANLPYCSGDEML